MSELLAIDVGYSQVKVVDDKGNKQVFPSFVDRSHAEGIAVGGGMDETVLCCGGVCNNQQYVVGSKSSVSLNQADNFHGSPEWYALMCKAVYDHIREFGNGSNNLKLDYLGIGLPLKQRNAEKIKEMEACNSFNFEVSGVAYSASAKKVVVFPQGMAMLQEIGFKEDEEVGLIDIGYGTLDIMVVDDGSLVSGSYTSLPLGVNEVYSRIKSLFSEKTKGASLSDRQAQKVLIAKKRTFGKKTISMTAEVKDVLEYYWGRVQKEIEPVWGDVRLLDRVVVGGGGAILLGDVFKDKLSEINVEVMKDPVFGNVVGYMKGLRTLSQEG